LSQLLSKKVTLHSFSIKCLMRPRFSAGRRIQDFDATDQWRN